MVFYKRKKKTTYRPKRVYKRKPMKKYRKRYRKKDDTITAVYRNEGQLTDWRTPADDKNGNVSNYMYATSDLQTLLSNNSEVAKMSTIFRQYRVKSVRVKVIPEKWNAAGVEDGSPGVSADGEKPIIHFINDEGSFHKADDPSIPPAPPPPGETAPLISNITFAQQNSDKYRRRLFDKDMSFNVKCYTRATSNDRSLGSDKYYSFSTWQSTNTSNFVVQLPVENLVFGFSNFKASWKYRVEYSVVLVWKQLYNSDVNSDPVVPVLVVDDDEQ